MRVVALQKGKKEKKVFRIISLYSECQPGVISVAVGELLTGRRVGTSAAV